MAAGTLYKNPENWKAFPAQYSGAEIIVLSALPLSLCQATVPWNFWKIFCREDSSIWEWQWILCLCEQQHYRLCKQWRAAKKYSRGSSSGGAWVLLTVTSFSFPHFGRHAQATENADAQGEMRQLDAFLKPRRFHGGKLVTLVGNTVVCTLLWFYKQVWEPTFPQVVLSTKGWFLPCINQTYFSALLV